MRTVNAMPVKIVLISRISIAVNVIAPHKQQQQQLHQHQHHHIQFDRQIIECLVVLIFHTLFIVIIGFDSIIFAMPSLSNNFTIGMGISSSSMILWHKLMVAALTHVFDIFNGQSVWTITINLIPAVDLMMGAAQLWPVHWIKIYEQSHRRRRQRQERPQNFMTIAAAHQNNSKSIFRFRKHFKSRCKMFAERKCWRSERGGRASNATIKFWKQLKSRFILRACLYARASVFEFMFVCVCGKEKYKSLTIEKVPNQMKNCEKKGAKVSERGTQVLKIWFQERRI